MMGSGKSTVGAKIAQSTGRPFYDTDSVIVEKYGAISDIFKRYGEKYFREIETQAVAELCKKDGLVIATGGGVVLKDENVALLKSQGKIVFLRAGLETLLKRLKRDTTRPLLQSDDPLETRLDKLLSERTPVYESVSDCIIDVDGKSAEENAKAIIALLGL